LRRLSELRASGVGVRVGVASGEGEVRGFVVKREGKIGTSQELFTFIEQNAGGEGMAKKRIEGESGPGGVRVLISLDKMSSIMDVSKESFVLEVEGGARWGDVKEALKAQGLYFPHWQDSMYEGMTVTELLMLGNRVRKELAYGKLRESVLALEIVTASGTVLNFGTRAVKNVVDYELIPFILEHGKRCGVITRSVLKLLPQPEKRVYLVAGVSMDEARELSGVLLKYLSPSFIEIMSGSIAGVFDGIAGGCSPGEGTLFVVALVEGSEAVVEARLKRLGRELSKSSARVYCFGEAKGDRLDDMESMIAERVDRGEGVYRLSFEEGWAGGTDVVSLVKSAIGDGFVVVESFPFGRMRVYAPVPRSGSGDEPGRLEGVRNVALIKKVGERYICFDVGWGRGVSHDGVIPESLGEDFVKSGIGADVLAKLNEALLKKFDPAGLMEGDG